MIKRLYNDIFCGACNIVYKSECVAFTSVNVNIVFYYNF